jgi:hypothetical protein
VARNSSAWMGPRPAPPPPLPPDSRMVACTSYSGVMKVLATYPVPAPMSPNSTMSHA